MIRSVAQIKKLPMYSNKNKSHVSSLWCMQQTGLFQLINHCHEPEGPSESESLQR